MHKKMLLVSEKVRANSRGEQISKSPISQSLDHLYAGQCNCPYWHGVFGGIYLPHIRTANYEHLIQAENIVDQIARGKGAWLDWELTDFDKDSLDELLVSGSEMNLYFDLARGGALFEWDWRAKNFNLLNTLSRREEGYHRDLVEAAERDEVELPGIKRDKVQTIHSTVVRAKEPGLEKQLNYDWYRRVGLIDHFLHTDTKLDDFARAQYGEMGDFVNQQYSGKVKRQKQKAKSEELAVELSREGHVWLGDDFVPVRVEKQLTIVAGSCSLPITYAVTNMSDQPIAARFGAEFCFGLLAGHSDDAYYRARPSPGTGVEYLDLQGEVETKEIALVNEFLRMEIALKLNAPTRIWRAPIETISLSEAGFERVYQGSCIMPLWDVQLKPREKWQVELEFELIAK